MVGEAERPRQSGRARDPGWGSDRPAAVLPGKSWPGVIRPVAKKDAGR